jgi:uncharacterized XkdX family phage protein
MSFWQLAYQFGWATKEDLKMAVQLKEITESEYETITGESYTM